MKLLFVLLLLLSSPVKAEINVYFSPSPDCENAIIDLIDKSEKIDIAVYAFTNRTIANEVKIAYQNGKKIRILTDKTQADYYTSQIPKLYDFGIDVKVNSEHRLQHNKYAIFDDKTIVTGSYNWTYSASYKNSENCLVISDEPNVISEYVNHFKELWEMNSQEKSDKWFLNHKPKKN